MLFDRYYALELCKAYLDKLFTADNNPEKYKGPVPPNEDILLQLAEGLEYIHGMNLIHRDLKPKNALIWVGSGCNSNEEKQVLMKWADFGLSKPVKDTGSFSMSDIRGTKKWFAPELFEILRKGSNEKLRGTVKSDVFAEGLTFGYVLLGGKHLCGDNNMDVDENLPKNNLVNLKRKLS